MHYHFSVWQVCINYKWNEINKNIFNLPQVKSSLDGFCDSGEITENIFMLYSYWNIWTIIIIPYDKFQYAVYLNMLSKQSLPALFWAKINIFSSLSSSNSSILPLCSFIHKKIQKYSTDILYFKTYKLLLNRGKDSYLTGSIGYYFPLSEF